MTIHTLLAVASALALLTCAATASGAGAQAMAELEDASLEVLELQPSRLATVAFRFGAQSLALEAPLEPREIGAEVVHHDWEGYARQKNWALDNLPITADWVLFLDADEYLSEEIKQEIPATIANLPAGSTGPARIWYGSAAASEWHDRDWLIQHRREGEDVRIRLKAEGIEFLLAQFIDIHGSPKVKQVPVECFDDIVEEGAGFAGGAVALPGNLMRLSAWASWPHRRPPG